MRARFLIALIAIIAGLSIVTAPPPVEAQTAKDCKKTCKTQKKSCLKGFQGEFKTAKGLCNSDFKATKTTCKNDLTGAERKTCIKEAKTTKKACLGDAKSGKAGKKLCSKGSESSFKECKACCQGDDFTGCRVEVCGDGVVGAGEGCDNGFADNSDTEADACRTNCQPAACGDGAIDTDEVCDDGGANSDTTPDACRTDCHPARCGDDVKDTQDPECDGTDNAACGGLACKDDCTCVSSACTGNDVLDPGEECNSVDDTMCPGLCNVDTCECKQARLEFTTGLPGGPCGRINDAVDGTGTDLTPYANPGGAQLDCGGLYIGGGASVQPPSPTPDGSTTIFNVSDATDLTAIVLEAVTSADTGTDRNCSAPGCFFGSPLPIPNPAVPAVSTCVINQIAATPPAGGILDATTGAATETLPLATTVYATGDLNGPGLPIQPCPVCVSGLCDFGPNAGLSCTPSGTLGTTHDCPPPGSPLPTFGVDLSPLGTGTATASDAAGDFCSATSGQTTNGCFGQLGCRYMESNGTPSGDLRDGLPHDGVLGSVFCIPSSGSSLIDAIADLPGTGAVSLTGASTLIFE